MFYLVKALVIDLNFHLFVSYTILYIRSPSFMYARAEPSAEPILINTVNGCSDYV